jgi:simple sugar transport system ATP-binding protein
VILDVDSISVVSSRGNRVIDELAFEIRAGEILGIAGVSGNGQEELAEVLCGLRKVEKGDIRVAGKSITNRDPLAVIAEGVGYIPSDRQKDGLVLDMTVAENLVLKGWSDAQFTSGCFLNIDAIEHNAEQQINEFSIKTPSVFTRAKALSGGNQQKVVVAREIAIASKLLVAVQPTRGLDLGATDYVHRVLLRERDEGKAVLLISTELQEIMSLSDRIGVMYRGSLLKVFSRENADIGEIGLLMTGVRGESNE